MRNLITILLALALAVSLWILVQPFKKGPLGAGSGDDSPIVVSDNGMGRPPGDRTGHVSLQHSPLADMPAPGIIVIHDYKPTPILGDPNPFTAYYRAVSVYIEGHVEPLPPGKPWELRIFSCPVSGSYATCPNPDVFRMGVSQFQQGARDTVGFNTAGKDFSSSGDQWIYNNAFIDHFELYVEGNRKAKTAPTATEKGQCVQVNYCLKGNCKNASPVNECLK